MTERWKKKKKYRFPGEEQPGYKSITWEQKRESPSAEMLLLFHCTCCRPVPHCTSWHKGTRNHRGILSRVFTNSSLNLGNHDILDCRLCRYPLPPPPTPTVNVNRIKAVHLSKHLSYAWKIKTQNVVYFLACRLGNPLSLFDWSQWIRPIPVGDGGLCTCGQKKKN